MTNKKLKINFKN